MSDSAPQSNTIHHQMKWNKRLKPQHFETLVHDGDGNNNPYCRLSLLSSLFFNRPMPKNACKVCENTNVSLYSVLQAMMASYLSNDRFNEVYKQID